MTSLAASASPVEPINALGTSTSPTTAEKVTEKENRPKSSIAEVVDDSIITTKIKASLLADGAVNDSAIRVETRHGTVVLSGFANSPVQIEQAGKIAQATSGVELVINKIAVRK